MGKNENVDPRGYYQGLTKGEKVKFLNYLCQRYDYAPSTMSGKLRENAVSSLRKDETENLIKVIESGVWRG